MTAPRISNVWPPPLTPDHQHDGFIHVVFGLQLGTGSNLANLEREVLLVGEPRVSDLSASTLPVGQQSLENDAVVVHALDQRRGDLWRG